MSRDEERAAEARRSCIEVAADFVAAQPDGPRRALALHSRRPDGTCAGCRTTPTPWPCTTATIARLAELPSKTTLS
ncbi:hypothetical protein [Pseudonocardia lacus]|uniref:hypothetical protein n=1 Tax=Pseudonocardia lacus TaxID=2835865 RepID=UPI001BDC9B6E|nr:hypothetical protein [Pseudonocardia lacus]